MKKQIFYFLLIVLIGIAACQSAAAPDEVTQAFITAANAGDVEAQLDLLTDDAVIQLIPPPMPDHDGIFSGKGEIRAWYENLASLHGIGELSQVQVDGDQVTALLTYGDDSLRDIGVDAIDNRWVVTVQDGKIQGYTVTMTDESLAVLMAAMTPPLAEAIIGVWQWDDPITLYFRFNDDGTYQMHARPWPSDGKEPLEALRLNPGDSGQYKVAGNSLTLTSGVDTVVCSPGDMVVLDVVFEADSRLQLTLPQRDECVTRNPPQDTEHFNRVDVQE